MAASKAWIIRTAIASVFVLASAGLAGARPQGHPGGGGGPHFSHGGGGPHFSHGGGGPHFSHGGGGPHMNFNRSGSGPHMNFSGGRGPHLNLGRSGRGGPHIRFGRSGGGPVLHFNRSNRFSGRHVPHFSRHANGPTLRNRTIRGAHTIQHANHLASTRTAIAHTHTNARNFASRRHFVRDRAFRPFLARRWHPHRHLGWIGPLFWPYGYGDFFYYALWPGEYWYYDPFWAYGYGDIYAGIFSPYNYAPYVQGPHAPARMAALKRSVTQSCADEAAEVTGWPIDQIQAAVEPTAQQTTLLDNLGNAVVKASDVVKSHCPTTVSFTPTGRLAAMQQRLEGMVEAVNIVQPPLAKFYDSLSDEQKARFNDVAAPSTRTARRERAAQNPQSQCAENVVAWPADRIESDLHPNETQRPKLDALNDAAAKAADAIKSACPGETPATPPARLAAEGKRLEAMLSAVKTIRPKLEDFYESLSDEQKARFNTIGRQLFAQK